jgi:hypothetical protein
MIEESETEIMSRRRAFSILGLAALSLAVSPTFLVTSDAEAAEAPSSTTTTQTTQTGTQRRQERRTGRTERRTERRTGRAERRTERRTGRTERRQAGRERPQRPQALPQALRSRRPTGAPKTDFRMARLSSLSRSRDQKRRLSGRPERDRSARICLERQQVQIYRNEFFGIASWRMTAVVQSAGEPRWRNNSEAGCVLHSCGGVRSRG